MLSNLSRLLTLALFLSAFLLFCCQPMVGKMVLPSLGGAAAVWTTCVLFFQAMLLAGYLYAWCLGRLGSMKAQLLTHVGIMALVFLALPIRFVGSVPAGNVSPVGWELLQLFRSVALPFFVVSTTAPLSAELVFKDKRPGRTRIPTFCTPPAMPEAFSRSCSIPSS